MKTRRKKSKEMKAKGMAKKAATKAQKIAEAQNPDVPAADSGSPSKDTEAAPTEKITTSTSEKSPPKKKRKVATVENARSEDKMKATDAVVEAVPAAPVEAKKRRTKAKPDVSVGGKPTQPRSKPKPADGKTKASATPKVSSKQR